MSEALKWDFISVDEYLASELRAETKSEFCGGHVYAIGEFTNRECLIASNATGAVWMARRSSNFQPFNSATKVRIQMPGELRFYYPDCMIVCDSNPPNDTFQDRPVVIIEVVSKSTRRVDESEKRDAYFTIPTLAVYLIVETSEPTVQVWRRQPNGGFERKIVTGLDSKVPLPEIEADLPLADLFDGIEFSAVD